MVKQYYEKTFDIQTIDVPLPDMQLARVLPLNLIGSVTPAFSAFEVSSNGINYLIQVASRTDPAAQNYVASIQQLQANE